MALLHDARIFISGGYNGVSVFDDLWALDLSAAAYLPQVVRFASSHSPPSLSCLLPSTFHLLPSTFYLQPSTFNLGHTFFILANPLLHEGQWIEERADDRLLSKWTKQGVIQMISLPNLGRLYLFQLLRPQYSYSFPCTQFPLNQSPCYALQYTYTYFYL